MTSGYVALLSISIDRMPFLEPTLDNADLLFSLLIKPGFYLHHIKVADQSPLRDAENSRIYCKKDEKQKTTNDGLTVSLNNIASV